jgi:hypothetical protein
VRLGPSVLLHKKDANYEVTPLSNPYVARERRLEIIGAKARGISKTY